VGTAHRKLPAGVGWALPTVSCQQVGSAHPTIVRWAVPTLQLLD